MKQMKKVILALLIAPVAFVSCKKSDSNPAPSTGSPVTVSVSPQTKNANGGDVIPFVLTTSSSNNLTTIVVMQSIGGGTATQVNKYDITSKSVTTYSYTESYTVPSGVTGPITLTWTVNDSKGNTNSATATVTIGTQGTLGASANVKLGNQNNSSLGSFYSVSKGAVYKVSDAKTNSADVDFIHFFGASNQAAIAAPSNSDVQTLSTLQVSSWSTKNNTQFVRVTGFDFAGATYTSVKSAFDNGSASNIVNNINVAGGDIVVFKTAANKYGVFHVNSVTGSQSTSGLIDMDVKAQQ